MNVTQMFDNKKWRWIDHSSSGLQFHPLQSFALDDTFCTTTGNLSSYPVMRAWVHAPTVMLGIQDSRLPYIKDAIPFLEQEGYQVLVRNSGGLAVILDEGVFNISLIFKEDKTFSIHQGYDLMWELIRLVFADSPGLIEAYEIEGSYCPGSYDLSINGKKFAGISQRRIRGGAAVQIYLAVTGSGAERAAVLREFYERASRGEKAKYEWPRIQPDVMASLSEIYGRNIRIQDILYRLLTTCQDQGAILQTSSLTEEEWKRFDYNYQRVMERNNKALEISLS